MSGLDLPSAQRLCAAALERARERFGKPVCAAVCDGDGFLIAFARGGGAPVRGIAISQGKAYTAARMGVSTTAFLERLHREKIEPGYFCDPNLTGLPGGNVIAETSGKVLGAIGISGLTSSEDQMIADELALSFGKDGSGGRI